MMHYCRPDGMSVAMILEQTTHFDIKKVFQSTPDSIDGIAKLAFDTTNRQPKPRALLAI